MNIPNILTAVRFFLIPVFGYYMYIQSYYIAVSLFLVAGITDVLDGYIARKYDMITPWGKLADPIADKLMQITALVMLTIQNKLFPLLLIIVIAKEAFMVAGGILAYKKYNFVVSADWYGKAGTVIFYLAIIAAMFNVMFSKVLAVIAVVFTLFAFFMYSMNFRKIKSDSEK